MGVVDSTPDAAPPLVLEAVATRGKIDGRGDSMDAHRESDCFIHLYARQAGEPARIDARGSVDDLAQLIASALGEVQFQGALIDAFVLLGGPQVLHPLGELGRAVARSQALLRETDAATADSHRLTLTDGGIGGGGGTGRGG